MEEKDTSQRPLADVPPGSGGTGDEQFKTTEPESVSPTVETVAESDNDSEKVDVSRPDFMPLVDTSNPTGEKSLQRFLDVQVTVTAELGKVTLPIGDLLQLGEGSVIELNRPISGPVDLVANGVRIARGEVVVVDDCFAVHIKEIEAPSARPKS